MTTMNAYPRVMGVSPHLLFFSLSSRKKMPSESFFRKLTLNLFIKYIRWALRSKTFYLSTSRTAQTSHSKVFFQQAQFLAPLQLPISTATSHLYTALTDKVLQWANWGRATTDRMWGISTGSETLVGMVRFPWGTAGGMGFWGRRGPRLLFFLCFLVSAGGFVFFLGFLCCWCWTLRELSPLKKLSFGNKTIAMEHIKNKYYFPWCFFPWSFQTLTCNARDTANSHPGKVMKIKLFPSPLIPMEKKNHIDQVCWIGDHAVSLEKSS